MTPGTLDIQNGNLELIFSGSMILDATLDTTFKLVDDGEPLFLTIRFLYSDTNEAATKAKALDSNRIQLDFINFTNLLGHWSVKPIPLGGMYNRELWMYYHIVALTDKPKNSDLKNFSYSLYIGDTFGTNPLFKKKEDTNG